ncbi:transcriptional regulator [Phytoactinopolyspora limicola]|uniref:transcriptional regulator n=1 Tax=Phytoactinopolyspora limicola TaxID=2715536 RepID=UPI00140C7D5D|nr:transcriptional regulator [Phytoactinopolyspora limicola]
MAAGIEHLGGGMDESRSSIRETWGPGSKHALALPQGVDAMQRWRSTARAHETFLNSATAPPELRRVILDSWRRSLSHHVDPDVAPPIQLDVDELDDARRSHPLREALPVIRRLLVDAATDAGVIVAIADAQARMLWVEGDPHLVRKAESIHLVSGSSWHEGTAGTNALGTALEVGGLVQIFGSEHFARRVHPWSCTAAPIRDPRSGMVCGVLDITGRDDVASPQSALLIRSTIAAVEAELRLQHTQRGTLAAPLDVPGRITTNEHTGVPGRPRRSPETFRSSRTASPAAHPRTAAHLRILGRERGELGFNGRSVELGLRHAELLLLLSLHPDGLSAAELAWKLYEHDAAEVTVRAEMSRLRKAWPELIAPASPYRLLVSMTSDAAGVADCLQRGAHRRALDLYRGTVLPKSGAPGVVEYRDHLHGWLRQSLLRHAGADVLLRYLRSTAGRDDLEVWRACLDRLPYGSHRRAEAQSAVDHLESELAAL